MHSESETIRKAALHKVQDYLSALYDDLEKTTSHNAGKNKKHLKAQYESELRREIDHTEARERELLRPGTQADRGTHHTYCYNCDELKIVHTRIDGKPICSRCAHEGAKLVA